MVDLVFDNDYHTDGYFAEYEHPAVGDLRSMFVKGGGVEGVAKVS